MSKGISFLLTLVVFVTLAIAIYFGYTYLKMTGQFPKNIPFISPPVSCTLEAKICPDGSAVGRTGPNCEFAPCPSK